MCLQRNHKKSHILHEKQNKKDKSQHTALPGGVIK